MNSFTDTNTAIRHRGITYQVLTTDHPDADSKWIVRSPRGILYMLLRNRSNPHHLFGVAWESQRNLPGWFSDQTGSLVSIS